MPALYFTSKIVGDGRPISGLSAAHATHRLVATAWASNRVIITTEDGERLAVLSRTTTPTAIAWHPSMPIAVIGWRDGAVTVWQEDSIMLAMHSEGAAGSFSPSPPKNPNNGVIIQPRFHAELPVMVLCWTSGGNALLSAAKNSAIGLWNLEAFGNASREAVPTTAPQYKLALSWDIKGELVTSAVHLSRAGPSKNDDDIAFALASANSSTVWLLDDSHTLTPLVALDRDMTVVQNMWDATRRRLFTLCANNQLAVHSLNEDLKATPVIAKKRLTNGAEADLSMSRIAWAPGNTIAMSAGEYAVKFFDLDAASLYTLRLPSDVIGEPRADGGKAGFVNGLVSYTNLCSNGQCGRAAGAKTSTVLAVATTNGKVSLWSYGGSKPTGSDAVVRRAEASPARGTDASTASAAAANGAPSESEDVWSLIATLDVEGMPESIRVLATGALMVTTGDNVFVLSEAFRRRQWNTPAAVVQTSPETVVVSVVNSSTAADAAAAAADGSGGADGSTYTATNIVVKSHHKVRDADLCFPNLALWSGSRLDLYTIAEGTGTATQLSSVDCSSPAFALHPDGIFRMRDGNKVVFENFQQQAISSLGFTDSEGTPVLITVSGDFVCVVTAKNVMKVARISTRELRQLGPARPLFGDVSGNVEISFASVNRRGKLVALLVRVTNGPHAVTAADVAADEEAAEESGGGTSPTRGGSRRVEGFGDPNNRIYVYDLDTDKVKFYDFGVHHETPVAACWNASQTPSVSQNAAVGAVSGLGGFGAAGSAAPGAGGASQLELESLLLAVETRSTLALSRRGAATPAAEGAAEGDATADALSPQRIRGGESDEPAADQQKISTLFVSHGTHNVTLAHQPGGGGIVLHNTAPLRGDQVCLVGCCVPHLIVSGINTAAAGLGGESAPVTVATALPQHFRIEREKMRDFKGMGPQAESDRQLRDALMRFGYYATLGNMDEAYRAIKAVKDTSVWRNLAKLCVVTRRLDVAEVCLANMEDGVAARALREAKAEPEADARIGLLAVSLGMMEEAEALFKKAKRPDLTTRLYLAANRWDDAQAHTEANDHIRIFSVAYQRAQFIEQNGLGLEQAIAQYERAQCGGSDVPRLLMQLNMMDDLKERVAIAKHRLTELNQKEGFRIDAPSGAHRPVAAPAAGGLASFTNTSNETPESINANRNARDLLIWWAQFLESSADVAGALQYYEVARDAFNVVRILCVMTPPQIDRAAQIVNNPLNREHAGAAYFIGRHYEENGNARSALQYLTRAGATRRAVRLAKTQELYGDAVSIALQSSDKALALECARYFEERSMFDRAAQLYERGGDMQRAIDVCIKGGLFEQLHQISESLDSEADPDTFIAMAEHFISSKHYAKAASMLVFAKAFNEALQLCTDKDVPLTEEMAETMTLPKSDDPEDEAYRLGLLKRLATIAKDQGSFHLACKKYTQAGDRVRALKMLLKAGDTDKVIFFANHSRQADIYTLAANYLQSQQWQSDTNIFKTIVSFYSKAKAYESLALFYDSVAQVQIDENREYDKALAAMNEGLKVLDKAGDSISKSKRNNYAQRVQVVEQFVQARHLYRPGQLSQEMLDACQALIERSRANHPDHDLIESAIRVGDVYALLVECYEKQDMHEKAFTTLEFMRGQEIELAHYLEEDAVKAICKKVGRSHHNLWNVAGSPTREQPRDDEEPGGFFEEEVI